jgi:hypothetical protein
MLAPMKIHALAILSLFVASEALAGASNFTLVNGTNAAIGAVQIRRAGTTQWKALGNAPGAGARGAMTFSDPDCAFDLQATVAGAAVTWAGVNLCDVKSVVLKHDSSAGAWVDYDQ